MNPKRLLPILLVTLAVLATLGLVNLGLYSAGRIAPRWYHTDQIPLPFTDLRNAAHRTTSAILAVEQGQAKHGLGIAIGQSTTREGFAPKILEKHDGSKRRWMIHHNTGGSFRKALTSSRPLFASQLRPDIVILGIHPAWLGGTYNFKAQLDPPISKIAKQVLGSGKNSGLSALKPLVWADAHRHTISHRFRHAFHQVRISLFGALDIPIRTIFPKGTSPWKVKRKGYPDRAKKSYLKRQFHSWTKMKLFEPNTYLPQNPTFKAEADAFEELVNGARGLGAKVIVIFLPESNGYRKKLPKEALKALQTVIKQRFGNDAPEVIDLRDALDEDMFSDYVHPNKKGRIALSKIVAKRLANLSE